MAPLLALGLLPALGAGLLLKVTWKDLSKALGVCVVAVLPFLWLILPSLSAEGSFRSLQDPGNALFMRSHNSISPVETLLWFTQTDHLKQALPFVLVLGLICTIRQKAARPWLVATAFSLLLAMGPILLVGREPVKLGQGYLPMPMALLDLLPGMARFWWPYRAMAVVTVAAAAVLAIGVSRIPAQRRLVLLLPACLLMILEGRHMSLKAVERTDPNLPESYFDPSPLGEFYKRDLPEWIHTPPEEGAILPFPFLSLTNYAHLHQPYHQLPTALGDGVGEELIRPEAFNQWVDSNLFLDAWISGGELPEDRGYLEDLREIGYRWILWHLPDKSKHPLTWETWKTETITMSELLGDPVHEEERLVVWDLHEMTESEE